MESSLKQHFQVYSEIVSSQLKSKQGKLRSERKEIYANMLQEHRNKINRSLIYGDLAIRHI